MKEKILAELKNYVETTKDLLMTEIPAIGLEILQWGFWESVYEAFSELIISILSLWFLFKIGMSYQKINDRLRNMDAQGLWILICIIWLVSFVLFFDGMHDLFDYCKTALKVKIAPKLYIIDYIKQGIQSW